MTISNTPIASTDFSRFFHDYVKHTPLQLTSACFYMTMSSTHLFNWLQQVFPGLYQTHSPLRLTSAGFSWLYQKHPSTRLTSASCSMTISNIPIVLTDFSRFFHDYIKHTHASTDFSRFFYDYIHTPSLRLTSAGFSMTISNTPIPSIDFSRFFHEYIKHTHRLVWLQQVFPWLYQTHPSLRLTSASFSMTIANTPIASTDSSRFFHDYIKHTHRLDWLQQVFQWLYQTNPSPRLTSPGFSMTISNIHIASTDFSRFFHDYVMHTPLQLTSAGFSMTMSSTHLFNWLQQVFSWLYQTHSSLRLTSAGFSMTISNKPIASTDFTWFFHDYIKHTHRLDWLQQVFTWLCQAHTPSTDFSRFLHDYVKHTPLQLTSAGFSMTISSTHLFNWLQQVFPSLYQTHSPLRLTSPGFFMTISNTPIASTDFSRFFHDYIKHTYRFDWLQQVFPWIYQTHPSSRLTSAGFSITISNTLTASTDFSRFFYDYIQHPIVSTDFSGFVHDYIKHTYRFDWLQQVFPWIYQTHPSSRLTSAGFSMTISNTSIASIDFSRFFHDYVKHTPLQLTSAGFFMTISNTLTASTDFSRFFHDYVKHTPLRRTSAGFYMTMSSTHLFNWLSEGFPMTIKHIHRLDWLQQVFPWLYQTHPSPRLTSAGFSMTISNITIASTDFSWFSHDYVKNTPLQLTSAGFSMTMSSIHLFNWLQQVFPWLCQAHTLQLTSASFSITISNILTASTDFSRVFHDYIKHTHLLDWLQQVFPWLCQTHPSPWLTSAGFSMTIKHTHRLDWLQKVVPCLCQAHTSSTDFSRFFHDYIKHSHRFDWLQQVFPWLYQTHSPLRLTSAGFSMTISITPIASNDFSRFFHHYIKHTHRFDWLQQVFPWLYQTHSPLRMTSGGFSMTISNTPIASTDFNRFFHDYVKHIHRFDWLQQVFPWLYQAHPSIRLTSAGCSMIIWNTPIAPTDFSRFFHDYIKHTHRLDWLQQVFQWLYQTHSPLELTSAGFSMTISSTPIASTDFSRFFHDYIKHTHSFDWLQQVFPWLYQTHPSPRLTSAGFSMTIWNTPIASTDFSRFFHEYIKHTHRLDWLQQVFPWLYKTHTSLRRTSACFSMTISSTSIASTDFSRFFHDYVKHTPLRRTSAGFYMTMSSTHLFNWLSEGFLMTIKHIHRLDWLQQVFPCLYKTHTSLRRTSACFSMTISNTSIASTDFSRFFHDYIKHTHRFDGLQQVFPWLYQTHPSTWLTSAGFSMTISNTLTSSTDFSRFFHDYIKHTHRLDWLHQVFPWLYQTHPSSWLTSAGFSMTMSNKHLFDGRQQIFPWLCQAHTSSTDFRRFSHDYQTHPSPRLTSAGFSMTISNITIASTDFSWFSHDYVNNTPLQLTSAGFFMTMSSTHLFNWLQQVFPWLCQAHTSSTDFSRFFHHYI